MCRVCVHVGGRGCVLIVWSSAVVCRVCGCVCEDVTCECVCVCVGGCDV